MDTGMDAPANLDAEEPARRGRGCMLSLLGFCVGMAGVVFFCAQAWAAMGPWSSWRVDGPLIVLKLPWVTIAGDLALALVCGGAACGAFLLGSALTGLIAER
jgi:hypothetical protein